MDAAAIVKRIRALSGITVKELAQLADLAPSTISRIERGILDSTWSTLSCILESTGYRISGDSIVSAGDPAAITAARPVLDQVLGSVNDSFPTAADAALEPTTTAIREWLSRWTRAGWLSPRSSRDDIVTLARSPPATPQNCHEEE